MCLRCFFLKKSQVTGVNCTFAKTDLYGVIAVQLDTNIAEYTSFVEINEMLKKMRKKQSLFHTKEAAQRKQKKTNGCEYQYRSSFESIFQCCRLASTQSYRPLG